VFIGVEVKAGRDQLRTEQKQFLDELKAAGFVVHSFAQFQQSFEGWRLCSGTLPFSSCRRNNYFLRNFAPSKSSSLC